MTWLSQFDNVLNDGVDLQETAEGIYSVVRGHGSDFYDKQAWLYDFVVGGRAYNRLVWGCPVAHYRDACDQALAGKEGPIIDIGCGSLVFTAESHARIRNHLIVLTDMSIGMLCRARDRLHRLRGGRIDNIFLLQADATSLPFKSNAFSQTMSWGALHVMPDQCAFIDELNRVTRPDGGISLSSLVTNRSFGARYLQLLQRNGHISALHSSSEVLGLLHRHRRAANVTVVGNMAFASAACGDGDQQ